MLKLIVGVLAVAIAGVTSAESWRSLRLDGSGEDAFAASVEKFHDKLSPIRRHIFGAALKDIWVKGSLEAEASEIEFTAADYHRHLDGLRYEQVVALADPTGEREKTWYGEGRRLEANRFFAARGSWASPPEHNWGTRPAGGWGVTSASLAQQQQQCRCMSPNGPQGY